MFLNDCPVILSLGNFIFSLLTCGATLMIYWLFWIFIFIISLLFQNVYLRIKSSTVLITDFMTCLTPTLHPAVISALTSGKVFPFWSFFPQDFESWLNFYINFINCELYHLSYIKNFLWSVVIYNLVFISGVQQSKSVIYPLFFIFLDSFPIIGHYRVLSRVACAIAASY